MRRVALVFAGWICLLATAAWPQEPQVTFELDADRVVVGQPLTLRIKILVPTWLPKPVVFPTLEVPSLMVRLPEGATGPISETVDRETWSGVRRTYRLYPLATGSFTLPTGELVITYADPGQPDPVVFRTDLPPVTFDATLPTAAAGLDPPIVAEGFTLEQTVEGDTELAAGDAVTRTITATITGTTPVLIPQLTPARADGVLRGYGKEPVVRDIEDRGELAGTRIETTTYIGQQSGSVTLPALSLDWFNLSSGKVETATLPAVDLTVTGSIGGGVSLSPGRIALWLGVTGLGLSLLWGGWRVFGPRLRARLAARRATYERSERAAFHRLTRALDARDLGASLARTEDWLACHGAVPTGASSDLEQALAAIGAARYGPEKPASDAAWRDAKRAARELQAKLRRDGDGSAVAAAQLPPLNP